MAETAKLLPQIQALGTQVAFVHMSPETAARAFFTQYGMPDIPRFADPDRTLYGAFELQRGTAGQLLGLKTMVGAARAMVAGHRQGPAQGDPAQMPGAFLLSGGEVVRSFYHASPADRPDVLTMATLPDGGSA